MVSVIIAEAQLLHTSPSHSSQQTNTPFTEVSTYANTNLTYIIIDAPNNTFCYDVFANGWLTVHQTSTPAIPGNYLFKTKVSGERAAEELLQSIKTFPC